MTPTVDNESTLLLHAYLDGELDPAHALELERQLASDPALAAERERIEALKRAIEERLPRVAMPPGLVGRIEAAIANAREHTSAPRWSLLRGWTAGRPSPRPSWAALAASVVVAMGLASSTTWLALEPRLSQRSVSAADEMVDMVVANHLRALMAPQVADVGSSDRHTVKPWFNGRVPEAPRVVDLSTEGFPLVGGRVDVLGRTPVPTLVYRRRQHLISLIAIPSDQAPPVPAERRSIAGYNVLSWTQDGVVYLAVSDVAAGDLEAFAKAFHEAAA